MSTHDPNDPLAALGAILAAAKGRLDYTTAYLPDEDPDAPFTIVAFQTLADGTSAEIAVVHADNLPEAYFAICDELARAGHGAVTVS